jgi:hypothetical protein
MNVNATDLSSDVKDSAGTPGLRLMRLLSALGARTPHGLSTHRCVCPVATGLLGWKPSGKNKLGWTLVPNFADVDNAESIRIAAGVLDALAVRRELNPEVPQAPGGRLQQAVWTTWARSWYAVTPTGNGWSAVAR